MNSEKTTKLIVADDHVILREGFRSLVKGIKEIELIGEASNGEELLAVVEEKKPDVVVTDIKMPLMNGIEATRHIKARYPEIKVIALSFCDEKHFILDVLNAGATGYLLKNVGPEELIEAVHSVRAGRLFLCNVASEKVMEKMGEKKEKIVEVPELTKREKELLKYIGRGLTTRQIALEMGITVRTVETHRSRLKHKLRLETTTQMALYAKEHGYA